VHSLVVIEQEGFWMC